MKNILLLNSAPLLSLLLLMVGSSYFTSYITLHMREEGLGAWAIGSVHTAYYLGVVVGALFAEGLIRRIGHSRAFVMYACINACTFILQGVWFNPFYWALMRVAAGLAFAGVFILVESWLLVMVEYRQRGRALSLYMMTLYGAVTAGQTLLDTFVIGGTTPFYFAALMAILAVFPIGLTGITPPYSEPALSSMRQFFHLSPLAFLGSCVSGMVLGILYSFGPKYSADHYLVTSYFMGFLILGGVCGQWPLGRLGDKLGRRGVLLGVSFAIGLPAYCIFAGFPGVYLLAFILGALAFALYPLSINHLCDRVDPHTLVAATGSMMFAYGTGTVIGPLLVPLFGQNSTFLIIIALGFFLALLGCVRSLNPSHVIIETVEE